MTRTPDEIKKGLECCTSRDCGGNKCPYFNEKSCNAAKSADALALIQQLQAENKQCHQENTEMYAEMCMLREKVHRLEAERDAAVADILYAASVYLGECNTCKNGEVCAACKRQDACDECQNSKCMCSGCGAGSSNWQWRGVQKGE